MHADRLETMYEDMKCDHYLFSIDHSDYIVDATKSGGTCRFVNHSCGCAPPAVFDVWSSVGSGAGLAVCALTSGLRLLCAWLRDTRLHGELCRPNCEVRTVSVEGVRRILLCSLQKIMAGEELCYDYRLAADPEKAIRCSCGSKRCRGWL